MSKEKFISNQDLEGCNTFEDLILRYKVLGFRVRNRFALWGWEAALVIPEDTVYVLFYCPHCDKIHCSEKEEFDTIEDKTDIKVILEGTHSYLEAHNREATATAMSIIPKYAN